MGFPVTTCPALAKMVVVKRPKEYTPEGRDVMDGRMDRRRGEKCSRGGGEGGQRGLGYSWQRGRKKKKLEKRQERQRGREVKREREGRRN